MKILIIGRSELLYDTAEALSVEHDICAVITAPASPEHQRREGDFEALAKRLGCSFEVAGKIDDALLRKVRSAAPDIAISVNWVSVIGRDFIDCFPYGILNAHCGDLPRYRGNAVINWAILRGEPFVQVTVHSMIAGLLDTGDVYATSTIPLNEQSTVNEVLAEAKRLIPGQFLEALPRVLARQPLRNLTDTESRPGFRCYPRLPSDGLIDWKTDATAIVRLVRASGRPYSGAFTHFAEAGRIRKIKVWRARVAEEETPDVGVPGHVIKNDRDGGETLVIAGRGIVALQEIEFSDDSKPISPGRYFRSIRLRLGLTLDDVLEAARMVHP